MGRVLVGRAVSSGGVGMKGSEDSSSRRGRRRGDLPLGLGVSLGLWDVDDCWDRSGNMGVHAMMSNFGNTLVLRVPNLMKCESNLLESCRILHATAGQNATPNNAYATPSRHRGNIAPPNCTRKRECAPTMRALEKSSETG